MASSSIDDDHLDTPVWHDDDSSFSEVIAANTVQLDGNDDDPDVHAQPTGHQTLMMTPACNMQRHDGDDDSLQHTGTMMTTTPMYGHWHYGTSTTMTMATACTMAGATSTHPINNDNDSCSQHCQQMMVAVVATPMS